MALYARGRGAAQGGASGPGHEAPDGQEVRVRTMTIQRFESGPRMSQAVTHGDMVYLAGQVAGTVVGAGVTAQTQEILSEIDRLLATAAATRAASSPPPSISPTSPPSPR